MRIRKLYLLIFCFAVVLTTYSLAVDTEVAPGFMAYKDPSSIYQLEYPSHWIKQASGNKVAFIGSTQEGSPMATIEFRRNLQGIIAPSSFYAQLKASYKEAVPDAVFSGDADKWIGGKQAHTFNVDFTVSGKEYHQETYIFSISKDFLELSLRAEKNAFPDTQTVFEQMLHSIVIEAVPEPDLWDNEAGLAEMPRDSEEDTTVDSTPGTRRRDPFIDPTQRVRPDSTGGVPGGKPPGIEGMMISEVDFVGILSSKDGFIAVFNGTDNMGYFLKVNDKLWDGEIIKITENAVHFKQKLVDQYSKRQFREVVKYLHPTEEGGK